jgi:hypothetical protein
MNDEYPSELEATLRRLHAKFGVRLTVGCHQALIKKKRGPRSKDDDLLLEVIALLYEKKLSGETIDGEPVAEIRRATNPRTGKEIKDHTAAVEIALRHYPANLAQNKAKSLTRKLRQFKVPGRGMVARVRRGLHEEIFLGLIPEDYEEKDCT